MYAYDTLPVKHPQRMTFFQQFLNVPLMQGSSNNEHNIVNHVAVSEIKHNV